jgi:hypothetical protein
LPALLLLCTVNASAGIKEFKLPTAADGEVQFAINTETKLPIGAADAKAQIVTAALTFLPKEKGQPLQWCWHYGIKFKSDVKIKSITVEDERDSQLHMLIQDDSPRTNDNFWSGSENSAELSKDFFNAMQAQNTWMLIRRFIVTYDDNTQSKLHQMIVETQPMRIKLLNELMTTMKANAN